MPNGNDSELGDVSTDVNPKRPATTKKECQEQLEGDTWASPLHFSHTDLTQVNDSTVR